MSYLIFTGNESWNEFQQYLRLVEYEVLNLLQ